MTNPTAADVGDVLVHTARAYLDAQRADDPALTPDELSMLRVLARRVQTQMADLAGLVGLPARHARKVLEALEVKGLVVRTADPADRRAQLIGVRETAAAVLENAEVRREKIALAFFERMSPSDRQTVVTLLLRADDGPRHPRKDH